MTPTVVLFTCDVECSIGNGGTFEQPLFRPWPVETWIWGKLAAGGRAWGIDLLMDQLDQRGMKGTFYVSALQHHYHGDAALAAVASTIEERGHEAGVHVHCAWQGFRGGGRAYDLVPGYHLRDSIGDHDEATQRAMLEEAVACLRKWTGREPRSFRAGNFGASLTTLRILAELGITSDSSGNAALGTLAELGTHNAAVETQGLLEIPATSFEALRWPRRLVRFVDPSNMTVAEARSVFDQVARLGIGTLVLTTHSFQYISPGHVSGERIAPRPRIVDRVSRILDLLARDPRFESLTMRQAAEADTAQVQRADAIPVNPAWMTAVRLAQSTTDAVQPRMPLTR